MKKPILKLLAAAAGSTLVLAGCITHNETVYHDVSRVKVSFENDRAARVFYEALSTAPQAKSGSESSTKIDLPLIFECKTHVVQGPSAAFNKAVELCDTNKDGVITEAEANIFAQNKGKL